MLSNLDINEFSARCKTQGAGMQILYHRGFLAEDRGRGAKTKTEQDIADMGNAAYDLFLDAYVDLVQRKHQEFDYSYIAIIRGSEGRSLEAKKRHDTYDALRKNSEFTKEQMRVGSRNA